MRYKALMIMLLVAGICWGQGVYKYDNVEITGTKSDEPVTYGTFGFTYQDSIATINIHFNKLSPLTMRVFNRTNHAIKVLWKDFLAYSDNNRYSAHISTEFIDDKRGGEQVIYGKGSKSFFISPTWSNVRDMFSKKVPCKGTIAFTIVENDISHDYFFNFASKIVK